MLLVGPELLAQSDSSGGAAAATSKSIPRGLNDKLAAGQTQEVIVEFAADAVDEEAAQLHARLHMPFAHRRIMDLRT